MVKDIALEQYVLCIPEHKSPLGRLPHIEVVLKRIRQGEPGAVLLDGHYLLTEAALAEEQELLRRTEGRA